MSIKALTLLIVGILALAFIPLLFDNSYYFHDDYEHQFMPVFVEIGKRLLQGNNPFVTAKSWYGGYFLGEYQYGVLNPFCMALYPLLALTNDLRMAAFEYALAHLLVLGLGTYVLARDYKLKHLTAVLVALSVCSNNFIAYWFASAWPAGLASYSWVPWALAWWRKSATDPRYILPGAMGIYMQASAGWPHTPVACALMFLALFFYDPVFKPIHKPNGAWYSAVAGALLSIISLLPLLTYHTSGRSSVISNDDMMDAPLIGLVNLGFPTHIFKMQLFSGYTDTAAPFFFMGILVLPVLGLLDTSRLKLDQHSPAKALLVACLGLIIISLGPAHLGLFRWPFRFVPYCALPITLLIGMALDNGWLKYSQKAKVRAVLLCSFGLLLAWQQQPEILLLHLASLLLLLLVVGALVKFKEAKTTFIWAAILLTLVGFSLTHAVYPANTNVANWRFPKLQSQYKYPPEVSKTDLVLTITSKTRVSDARGNIVFSGNSTLLTDVPSINGYTPLEPRGLKELLCFDLYSWSCRNALRNLAEVDGTTQLTKAQLLGLTRIIVDRRVVPNLSVNERAGIGSVCYEDKVVTILCMDRPKPEIFPITWMSDGVKVSKIVADDDGIDLTVDNTDQESKTVILSRAWRPGMIAELDGKPLHTYDYNGISFAVDLPSQARGTVKIDWRFPFLAYSVAAFLLACVVLVFGSLHMRRHRSAAKTLHAAGI